MGLLGNMLSSKEKNEKEKSSGAETAEKAGKALLNTAKKGIMFLWKITPFPIKMIFLILVIIIIAIIMSLINNLLELENTVSIITDTEEVLGRVAEGGTNLSGGSASIAEAAKKIHAYMEQNGYYYYTDDGSPLPSSNDQLSTMKSTCCATFVYWVCLDAGYISQDTAVINNVAGLVPLLKNLGFTTVDDVSQRQDGDILVYGTHHIDIAASDASNTWKYNAGSTKAIQAASPPGYGPVDEKAVTEVLRAPAK